MAKPSKLKTIFFGTPGFAAESLSRLVESQHEVAAVVTAPDKRAGRGKKLQISAVKKFALEKGIEVLQPTNLKDEKFVNQLRTYSADVFTVVAFRMLPEVVWNMPPLGTINVHASLLPRFRGAAPINHAIINGEHETGVTTFKLQHAIDTGNILLQEKTFIDEHDNAGSLHDKLMIMGGELLLKTLNGLLKGDLTEKPQGKMLEAGVELSKAPKLNKQNTRINWSQSAGEIHNFIRGLSPYPGAYTKLLSPTGEDEKKITIYWSEPLAADAAGEPGSFVQVKKRLIVNTGNGQLEIKELKPEGKRQLKAGAYLNGAQLTLENKMK